MNTTSEKTQKYYKVVAEGLVSVWTRYISIDNPTSRRDFIVQYKLHEWIKPNVKGSKLFVFDALMAARDFAEPMRSQGVPKIEVYECRVKNPGSSGVFMDYILDQPSFALRLWEEFNVQNIIPSSVLNPPNGTIWVDEVKLIRKVDKGE